MRSFSARDGSGLDGRGYLSRDRRRRGVCSECRLLVAQWPPSQLTHSGITTLSPLRRPSFVLNSVHRANSTYSRD